MGLTTSPVYFYGRVVPERLITGLLTVNVRNVAGLDDAIEEYYNHWNLSAPFTAPTAGKAASPFNNIRPTPDPARTTNNLEMGDYSTYLFFVTIGASMGAHTDNGTDHSATVDSVDGTGMTITDTSANFPTVPTDALANYKITNYKPPSSSTTGTISGNGLHTIDTDITFAAGDTYKIIGFYDSAPTHPKCQSFVRYRLISHMNNAYGHVNTTSNYFSHYGQDQSDWTLTSPGQGQYAAASLTNQILMNNGIFSTNNFGSIDLSTDAYNTWFNPVHDIDIYGSHSISTLSFSDTSPVVAWYAAVHDTSFYNVVLAINLFGYPSSGNNLAFFKNMINVHFQPFGETADIKFGTTEYTT